MLNTQLEGQDYIVGNAFTIADIATYPWARAYYWANVPGRASLFRLGLIALMSVKQRSVRLKYPSHFGPAGKGDVAAQERKTQSVLKLM